MNFDLPTAPGSRSAPALSAADARPAGGLPSSPADPQTPINILIVDDEPRNLTALETVLDDPGYRLVRAGSADEALLALVAEEFALLILDIQMPGMNGFELAQMIKERKKTAGIPIIFLTAYYSQDEHVLEGYSTGAVDYLHKPINATVLRSKVAVFAQLHRKNQESLLVNRTLLAEVAERQRAQAQLREANEHLERWVAKRTEALSESEARFRALAEEMPHLVWETDPTGQTTYQNARGRNYTGLTAEQMRKDWRQVIHPDDATHLAAIWASALASGEECDTHCRFRRASDGEYRWFHIKGAPVRDSTGQIARWVGTGTDIHEQRRAEEALREAGKRKDEFLAMLGHELRNPLAAIRHAVQIARESPPDPAACTWTTEVIDRQSVQLSRMVDDLLDVARISTGRIELRSEVLDLQGVFTQAIAVVRPLLEERGHAFAAEIGGSNWTVQGDPARLEQIFVNLLNNAAKYTPNGGRIRLVGRTEGTEVVVSIIDNGIGIAPELLPHVFDIFRQAETSLDRAQGGLGIGLTVVKSLIEMHRGRVSVESGANLPGTAFTVRLPLLETPAHAEAKQLPAAPRAPSRKLRILIVDDHVDAGEALRRLLVRRNFEVRVAHEGSAGVVAAQEFQPKVLLLDLGLPGLDGYELARTLRADPAFANALFIAISGYAQASDRERSMAAGFEHHCSKPVDFGELLSVIYAKFQEPTAV